MAIVWNNIRGAIHLFLAGHHTDTADLFFRYITYVGAYGVFLAAAVALLLRHRRWAASLLLSELCSTIIVQALKHLLRAPRPVTWFAEQMPEVQLPLVDGQQIAYWLSFPSGHTASCFVLCFWLCRIPWFKEHKVGQAACILLACLCAYSRIYLQMHFLTDVLAGALIGTLSSVLVQKKEP